MSKVLASPVLLVLAFKLGHFCLIHFNIASEDGVNVFIYSSELQDPATLAMVYKKCEMRRADEIDALWHSMPGSIDGPAPASPSFPSLWTLGPLETCSTRVASGSCRGQRPARCGSTRGPSGRS